jgi:preprotein translocase subunit YajC
MPACEFPSFGAATGGGEAAGGGSSSLLFMVLMLAVFFFLMILPQRKRNKKVKEMLASVSAGNKIKTIGGFYGTVESVKDDLVTVVCDPDQIRMVISKSAIAAVENSDVENDVEPSK